jgi:hypothetical protein
VEVVEERTMLFSCAYPELLISISAAMVLAINRFNENVI